MLATTGSNVTRHVCQACMAMSLLTTSWQLSDEIVFSMGAVRRRRIFVPGQLVLVILLSWIQLVAFRFLAHPRQILIELSWSASLKGTFPLVGRLLHVALIVAGIRLWTRVWVRAAVSWWGPHGTDQYLTAAAAMTVMGAMARETDVIRSVLRCCLVAAMVWLASARMHQRNVETTRAVVVACLVMHRSFT
jgi:hypothetical protein